VRISGGNRAEYWLWADEERDSLNYTEHFENKLTLSSQYQDLLFRGVFFIWDPSSTTQRLQYIDYTIQYRKRPVSILYGTYYTVFGRGLVLNTYYDEDFRQDNSLFGVKAEFDYLKSHLTVLSGNPRNIAYEQFNYFVENDTTDQIRGIDFSTKLIPRTTVGGRYVRVNRANDLTPKSFTEVFGGSAGFVAGAFDAYVEYARLLGTRPVVGGRLEGSGLVMSTSLSLPGLGASLQYVDYDSIGTGGFGYRYNEPPTPIASGISVNQGIDEIGYGVAVIYSPSDKVSIEIQNNKLSTHDDALSKAEEVFVLNDSVDGVLEQIAKVITYPSYQVEATAGVERTVKQGIEASIDRKTELKPYVECTYDFGPYFVEAGYEHNFISSDTSDYYEHAGMVAIGKPELFVLSFRYERRNRVPEWLVPELGEATTWPLVELSLDITSRHNLRIRAGAEKGGLVCSGGVCRFEPPFQGVKLVLSSIF
jgi:hypothetical protein